MEKQHLIWQSVELEDKVTISDYQLKSGTTLQLVTAMRGGPLNIRRGVIFLYPAPNMRGHYAMILSDVCRIHRA